MLSPSKIFCCWVNIDFRLLLKRNRLFFLSSFSHPNLWKVSESLYLSWLYPCEVCKFSKYCFIPPTLRSIAMLLSFSIMRRSLGVEDALFSPSKASPPLIEPSPITATTCRFCSPFKVAATAIPNAAEMEFDACPHVKVSYSLSSGDGKGRIPFSFRFVQKRSRLPVRILCPYA